MAIKAIRIALYTIIGFWGMLSLAILASEENAANPIDMSEFVMLKLGAGLSLALCVLCGCVLNKCGLLPFKTSNR